MGDTLKSVSVTVQKSGLNSKIKSRLNDLIGQVGKKARLKPPMTPGPKLEFLTPEKVQKEFEKDNASNFEVIDYTGRFVLIPAGYPVTSEIGQLLIQLVKANPQALYIRKADLDSKSLADKNYFPKEYWPTKADLEFKPNEVPDIDTDEMVQFLKGK